MVLTHVIVGLYQPGNHSMRALRHLLSLGLLISAVLPVAQAQRVEIKLDPSIAAEPLTGRVFVFLSRTNNREPRLLGGSYGGCVPFFGADVEAWTAKRAATIDKSTLGYPYASLAQVPAGDYYA